MNFHKLLHPLIALITLFHLAGCANTTDSSINKEAEKLTEYSFKIKELNDSEYPDNPDIGFRSENYNFDLFKDGQLIQKNDSIFSIRFMTRNNDSIYISDLDINSWLPSAPLNVRSDDYLTKLAIVNQEWNRNQVKFTQDEFSSSNGNLVRIDVARNCLNSELWEVIAYEKIDGKELAYAHGWFDFPADYYETAFSSLNKIGFDNYRKHLIEWTDLENKPINQKLIREVKSSKTVEFSDLSNAAYPLAGAREKKRKEIITPASFNTMKDLQSDQTTFATFTPPGFYNRKDPRRTELGRFRQLDSVQVNKILSRINDKDYVEIKLYFSDPERYTVLNIGGVNPKEFPVLDSKDANSGWKNSMGFGNHTFYENLSTHESIKSIENPYYAYLSDENGNWLDSHLIGIDGPIFHLDKDDKNLLHLWLLSFERHALIGHYTINFK